MTNNTIKSPKMTHHSDLLNVIIGASYHYRDELTDLREDFWKITLTDGTTQDDAKCVMDHIAKVGGSSLLIAAEPRRDTFITPWFLPTSRHSTLIRLELDGWDYLDYLPSALRACPSIKELHLDLDYISQYTLSNLLELNLTSLTLTGSRMDYFMETLMTAAHKPDISSSAIDPCPLLTTVKCLRLVITGDTVTKTVIGILDYFPYLESVELSGLDCDQDDGYFARTIARGGYRRIYLEGLKHWGYWIKSFTDQLQSQNLQEFACTPCSDFELSEYSTDLLRVLSNLPSLRLLKFYIPLRMGLPEVSSSLKVSSVIGKSPIAQLLRKVPVDNLSLRFEPGYSYLFLSWKRRICHVPRILSIFFSLTDDYTHFAKYLGRLLSSNTRIEKISLYALPLNVRKSVIKRVKKSLIETNHHLTHFYPAYVDSELVSLLTRNRCLRDDGWSPNIHNLFPPTFRRTIENITRIHLIQTSYPSFSLFPRELLYLVFRAIW